MRVSCEPAGENRTLASANIPEKLQKKRCKRGKRKNSEKRKGEENKRGKRELNKERNNVGVRKVWGRETKEPREGQDTSTYSHASQPDSA